MQHRLGRYLIEQQLGKGGMGVVYRAVDERLGKAVALKLLSDVGAGFPDGRDRLRREARAAAILNHPSIVAVFDYDEIDGQPFIVYELVEGQTLEQLIANGPLPESRIVDIARQVASALGYAHERGILHRDIKPQNIIMTAEGVAKILDYGLAKQLWLKPASAGSLAEDAPSTATASGTIVGTVQYMSPEQIGGDSLDGRSDLFSLGVVLFELASCKNPFMGDSFVATVGRIVSPDPDPSLQAGLNVSQGLSEVIGRCLRKRREERYPSAQVLLDDLLRLGNHGLPLPASRTAPPPVSSPIPRPVARTSLILLQLLYLGIYAAALVYHFDLLLITGRAASYFVHDLSRAIEIGRFAATIILVSGCCGIPVRLYLIASVGFDDRSTGQEFDRLYPYLFALDEVWALSPLLLAGRWSPGIALICFIFLAYLPISHRNLIRGAYPSD